MLAIASSIFIIVSVWRISKHCSTCDELSILQTIRRLRNCRALLAWISVTRLFAFYHKSDFFNVNEVSAALEATSFYSIAPTSMLRPESLLLLLLLAPVHAEEPA